MPDNDPHSNAPHLRQRLAVPAAAVAEDGAQFDNWGGRPVPAHVRTMHQHWAGEYVRLFAEGDTGGTSPSCTACATRSTPARGGWSSRSLSGRWRSVPRVPGNGVNVSAQLLAGDGAAGSEGGEQGLPPSPAATRPAPDPAPGLIHPKGPIHDRAHPGRGRGADGSHPPEVTRP
ncbi:MAG: hypothetical protein ACLP8X_44535 [Streptosporangiaceae bacterium]